MATDKKKKNIVSTIAEGVTKVAKQITSAVGKAASVAKTTAKSAGVPSFRAGNRAGSDKWYAGDAPTQRETVARMFRIANGDKARFQELEQQYNQEVNTIGSPIYNPYGQATNWKAIDELTALGYDLSGGVTSDWIAKNRTAYNDKRTTTTGYTPAAPTKKSTAKEDVASWIYQLDQQEDTTIAAETEYKALANNVKYLVDRGYSDEAILKKIRNEDFASNYKTLAKMDTGRIEGNPVRLNRAVNYSGDDTIYGMIWAARNNGGSGDYFVDSVLHALGEGNHYKSDPTSEAARDPSDYEDYHPYYGGSTLHEVNMRTGQNSYDDDWLNANRSMLNGTEQEKRDWQDIYDANENTKAAQAELAALDAWTQQKIERGYSADEISDMLSAELERGDYSTLRKMERERARGGYLNLTAEVDYTLPRYQQKIRDMVDADREAKEKAEAEAKAQAEAEAAQIQAEREAKAEAAIAGGSAFMSGGVDAAGNAINVGTGVAEPEIEDRPNEQPAELTQETPEDAPEEVAPMATVRPEYGGYESYKSVFGVIEETPREGMAGGEAIPQAARGTDVGQLILLGANGSGKMDPNSEEGQRYIAMLNGGVWDGSVYAWAMRNSSNRAALEDELEQGILALRSGTSKDSVSGLALSWWNSHAHLVDYTVKGIDYSRNIGVVDDQYDAKQYYGDEIDAAIRANADAEASGSISREQYVQNLIELADVTDIVDGMAEQRGADKRSIAEEVLANVPGQARTVEDVYTSCMTAVEDDMHRKEASEQEAMEASRAAVEAYNAGTATPEQQLYMENVMASDVSAEAAVDKTYQRMMGDIRVELTPESLMERGMDFTTGNAETDAAMGYADRLAAGARAYSQGVMGIAEAKLQSDMKMAAAAGMSLDGFYEAYPERSRNASQILAEAENEYNAAWQQDFGGTINGLLRMNAPEAEGSVAGVRPEDSLTLRQAIELGTAQFNESFNQSLYKTWDFLMYKSMNSQEARAALYREYGGDREAFTADLAAYTESLPEGDEQRAYLEAFMGSGQDAFAIGKTIGQLKSEKRVAGTEANMQAIQAGVERYGTEFDKFIVEATSAVESSITLMAASGLGAAAGLSPLASSVVAAVPEGGSTGYDLSEQGASYGAALGAAAATAFVNGALESKMNVEYMPMTFEAKRSTMSQWAKNELSKTGFLKLMKNDPGFASKLVQTALYTTAGVAANAAGEGTQEFVQSLAGSIIKNGTLNLSGLRNGMILDESDLTEAGKAGLMGMVTAGPLSIAGSVSDAFSPLSTPMTDIHGDILTMAEAQALPEFEGVLMNEAIETATAKEAVYAAAADLEALVASNEYAAADQAQIELEAAIADEAEARQEYERLDGRMTAMQRALSDLNEQMRGSDVFDADMQKQMTSLCESILADSEQLTSAQAKLSEKEAAVATAQQARDAAEKTVQRMYNGIMETAKQQVRQMVIDRLYAGSSEEIQIADAEYRDRCAELAAAKDALRSARADLDVYRKGSAKSEAARRAYGEALIEVDRLVDEVNAAKAAADAAWSQTPEALAEEIMASEAETAEAAAVEAEAIAAAAPDDMQAQSLAAALRAEANAQAAAANLEQVLKHASEQLVSADRSTRAQAVQDYQAAVREAEKTATLASEARSAYDAEYSAQGKLQKAIENVKQYSNDDLMLEESESYDAALEAEAELEFARAEASLDNARTEMEAARDAMDASNPSSVTAYQEAREKYREMASANNLRGKKENAAPVMPIAERSLDDTRDKTVQPFFNTDREKYAPYIEAAAKQLRADASNSTPGRRTFVYDGLGSGQGSTPLVVGTSRSTTDLLARWMDTYKWGWQTVKANLDKFISAVESGKPIPNTPNMKRIEMMVNEMLSDGYTNISGDTIQPAYDYIRLRDGDDTLVFEGEDSDGISFFDAYGVGTPIGSKLRRQVAEALQANPTSAVQTASGRYLLELDDKLIYTDGNADNPAISEVIINRCAGYDPDMDEVLKEVLIEADGKETFDETWEGCAGCFRDVFGVPDPLSRFREEVHTAVEGDARGAAGRSGSSSESGNQPGISFKRNLSPVTPGGSWVDHAGAARTDSITTADKNPIEIMRDLTKSIGVGYNPGGSMSVGNRRLPSNVQGFYNNLAKSITTRTSEEGDMALGLHEFGHAVQDRLPGLKATPAMVAALPAAVRASYNQIELEGEATAEFVCAYMYDRNHAIAMAGNSFVQDFEDMLRNDKSLYNAVMEGRTQIELWNNADTGSKIGSMTKDANASRRGEIGNWLQRKWRDIETAVFDLTAPADMVSRDFRKKVQYGMHASRRAGVALTKFLIDPNGQNIGKSFAERFYDAGVTEKDMDEVCRFALARHALDRLAQGKPVFDEHEITEQELRDYVAKTEANSPHIVAGADAITSYWNDFMDAWWVQTGMIDQDAVNRMRAMYPHYVPTFRVVGKNFSQYGGNGARFNMRAAVKGGSSLEVINPIASIVKMTEQMVGTVTQNRTMQAFHAEMQKGGLGELAERVPQDMVLRETDTTALQATLDAINASGTVDPALMGDAYAEMLNLQEKWYGTGQNYGKNVVSGVDENGIRFFYRVKDDAGEGLYNLLSGSSNQPQQLGRIMNGLRTFKNTFTALTTGSNPLFAIKNMQRDIQASVNTGTHSVTYVDGMVRWIGAFAEVLSGSDGYKSWQAMGGGSNTRINTETESADASKVGRELSKELMRGKRNANGDFKTRSTALEKISNILTLEALNNAVENASRYVEYRYGKHDLNTAEGREAAFMASQDVTTNFGTHGASGFIRMATQVVPFMNATLQGLNKDINIVKDLFSGDPVRSRQAAPKAAKTVFNTGLTAMLQYAVLKMFGGSEDEEDYELLNQEMRTGNLVIPIPKAAMGMLSESIGFDKPYIRIPIAQGVMAQGTYAAMLDLVSNVTDYSPLEVNMWEAAKSILADQIPDGTVYQAFIDAQNNRTWYGGEIESEYMRQYSVTNRTANDTPAAVAELARMMNVSPAKLDYLLNQYSGFAGKIIMPLISAGKYSGEYTAADSFKNLAYSVLSNYTIDPISSNSLSSNYTSAKDTIAEIIADGKAGMPMGNLAYSADGHSAYREAEALSEDFKALDKEIAAHWADYNAIKDSPRLSDAEKANQMRDIRRNYIIPLQKEALALYEEYKMRYIDCDSLADWISGVLPNGEGKPMY